MRQSEKHMSGGQTKRATHTVEAIAAGTFATIDITGFRSSNMKVYAKAISSVKEIRIHVRDVPLQAG